MSPLVTIGVPFYNSRNYIAQTLDSIREQTYNNLQLVLIDDCSADGGLETVREWVNVNGSRFTEVIMLQNAQNRGTSYSCKRLQEAASGVFFSKLDADDIILPNKVAKQVECLLDHPDAALVYSNTQLIDSNGVLLEEDYFAVQNFRSVVGKIGPSGFLFDQLLEEDFIPNSSVLMRKEALEKAGGYDETLFTEDWDLWLRISKMYPIRFLEGCYSQYRIHPQSVMRNSSSLVKMYSSSIRGILKHEGERGEHKKTIARHLNTYAVGMYRYGVIDTHLLRKNFIYNRTFKAALYYLLGMMNLKLNQKIH